MNVVRQDRMSSARTKRHPRCLESPKEGLPDRATAPGLPGRLGDAVEERLQIEARRSTGFRSDSSFDAAQWRRSSPRLQARISHSIRSGGPAMALDWRPRSRLCPLWSRPTTRACVPSIVAAKYRAQGISGCPPSKDGATRVMNRWISVNGSQRPQRTTLLSLVLEIFSAGSQVRQKRRRIVPRRV